MSGNEQELVESVGDEGPPSSDEEDDEEEEEEEEEDFVVRFAKLYEKLYPGVTTVAWCPKMDLIAVASRVGHKSKVAVIRSMSWDVLHSIELDEAKCKVSALTWSPDGRNLAAGLEDGQLLLFDVESGLPWPSNHSIAPLGAAITCLRWSRYMSHAALALGTAGAAGSGVSAADAGPTPDAFSLPSSGGSLFSMFRDRAHRLVPHIGALPVKKKFSGFSDHSVAVVSSFCGSRSRSDRILGGEANPDEFDMLVVGCSSGKIALYAYGDLLCAELESVPADKAFLNIGVVDVSLAADFSSVAALVATNKGAKTPLPCVQLLVFDAGVLHRHHRPLACAADHLREVWKLHERMLVSARSAAKTWGDVTGPVTALLAKLSDAIAECAPGGDGSGVPSVLQELQTALADGLTDSLVHFFSAQKFAAVTSASALKRLLQGLRQGLDQCQSVVRSHVAKPCENAVFRLAELRGLASAREASGPLGLHPPALSVALEQFEALALAARSVVRHLVRATLQLCALVAFLAHLRHETNDADNTGDGDADGAGKEDRRGLPPCNFDVVRDLLHEAGRTATVRTFLVGATKLAAAPKRSAFDFVGGGDGLGPGAGLFGLGSRLGDGGGGGVGAAAAASDGSEGPSNQQAVASGDPASGPFSDVTALLHAFAGEAAGGDAPSLLNRLEALAAAMHLASQQPVQAISKSMRRAAQLTLPVPPTACHEGRVAMRSRVPPASDTQHGNQPLRVGGLLAWVMEDDSDSDSDEDSDDDDSDGGDDEGGRRKTNNGPAPLSIPLLEWGWVSSARNPYPPGSSDKESDGSDCSDDDNDDDAASHEFEDIVTGSALAVVSAGSKVSANANHVLSWRARVLKGVPHYASTTTDGKPRLAFYGGLPSDQSRNGELLAVMTRCAPEGAGARGGDEEDSGGAEQQQPLDCAQMSAFTYEELDIVEDVSGGRTARPDQCHAFIPTLSFVEAAAANATEQLCKFNVLEGMTLASVASFTTCGNRGVAGAATTDGKFHAYDLEDEQEEDEEEDDEEEGGEEGEGAQDGT